MSTYNIAINKYIKSDRITASVEVIKYLTSKEVQKKYIIEEKILSPMKELYEDDDVCKVTECNLIKSIQPFSVINYNNDFDFDLYDIDNYFRRYKEYLHEFIYDNSTISETIKNIDDITKFYKLTLDSNESYIGIMILVSFLLCVAVILLLLIIPYIKKYEKQFKFLPNDFWIIFVFGSLIMSLSICTLFGEVMSIKCQMRRALLSLGFTLNMTPLIYKLISNFPEKNKVVHWISNHRYGFLGIVLSLNSILNILSFVKPYKIENKIQEYGENYRACVMESLFGNIMIHAVLTFVDLLIFVILFLLFVEWNIEETYRETRLMLSAMYMDFFVYIIYSIFDLINADNFYVHNLIKAIILFLISFSNYMFIYGFRILLAMKSSDEEEISVHKISSADEKNKKQIYFMNRSDSNSSSNNSSLTNFSNKMFEYHFRKASTID